MHPKGGVPLPPDARMDIKESKVAKASLRPVRQLPVLPGHGFVIFSRQHLPDGLCTPSPFAMRSRYAARSINSMTDSLM